LGLSVNEGRQPLGRDGDGNNNRESEATAMFDADEEEKGESYAVPQLRETGAVESGAGLWARYFSCSWLLQTPPHA
jgi:hypothetical protein